MEGRYNTILVQGNSKTGCVYTSLKYYILLIENIFTPQVFTISTHAYAYYNYLSLKKITMRVPTEIINICFNNFSLQVTN